MTLLLDIAPFSPPASPSHTGRQIYQRFEDDPDLLVIAVVDVDGRPVGLVERNAFLVRMAAQYGYALWSDRPISQWMKTGPLVADGDMTVEEFCGRVLEERPSELFQGFIVTCAGRYAGVGTALSLLQVTAAATASRAKDMSRLAESAQEALAAKGRFLAVMSHEIRSEAVEDGAAAVEAAATGRFGLVLMDVKMPGMDGVEATRRIRSGRRAGALVPILALTANADPADAAFYRLCGMNGVVEKPVKPERLLDAMNAVLLALVAPEGEAQGVAELRIEAA